MKKTTVAEIKIAIQNSSNFFNSNSMKFFGDRMSSFQTIKHSENLYIYRKPSAMVNTFTGWQVCGHNFFGCWEFNGKSLNKIIGEKKEEIYQIVKNR